MHKMEAFVILLLPIVFTFSLSLADQAPPACDSQTPTDVVLVIDASNSVGYANYRTQLQFLANITQHFNIGSDRFRFAAVSFSTSVHKLFDLRTYEDTVWISQALLGADYDAASTNTAGALKFITDEGMFNRSEGGRESANKHVRIVVLITDGESDNPEETIKQAVALHQQHVHVVAIGVGMPGGSKEFTNIVNDPRNTFTADSYGVLNLLEVQVVNRICDITRPISDLKQLCTQFRLPQGMYPSPDDCSAFLECGQAVSVVNICPSGFKFNSRLRTCDQASAVDCSDNYYFSFENVSTV